MGAPRPVNASPVAAVPQLTDQGPARLRALESVEKVLTGGPGLGRVVFCAGEAPVAKLVLC